MIESYLSIFYDASVGKHLLAATVATLTALCLHQLNHQYFDQQAFNATIYND